MTVLETRSLTKKYRRITALHELDLSIESGMVFGLLGPNGSGKTTTLGLLLGVLQATSGDFSWFDEAPSADSRKRIGAILETPCFYPYLSAEENLRVACRIKECHESNIDRVLEIVGLLDRKKDPFKTYSLGMKQRLAIGSALLSDPEVLILDEPTNGLDPEGIVEIRDLIRYIAKSGKTIILASHLLDEVQKVCTHFAVLRRGEKLYQGGVIDTLIDQSTIDIAAAEMEELRSVVQQLDEITSWSDQGEFLKLTVKPGTRTEDINRKLIESGVILSLLAEKPGSLESQFLKILNES